MVARHSKSFSLIDWIALSVDRVQRNFEPMRNLVGAVTAGPPSTGIFRSKGRPDAGPVNAIHRTNVGGRPRLQFFKRRELRTSQATGVADERESPVAGSE